MKIHMDYLENKIELFQAQMQQWDKEKSKLQRSAEMAQEKLQLIKENKDREIKDLNRKLSELASKLKAQVQKTGELQDKINQDCAVVSHPYCADPLCAFFGVFDGHGRGGEVVSTAVMDFVVEELEARLLRDEQISAAISHASAYLPTSPLASPHTSPHFP